MIQSSKTLTGISAVIAGLLLAYVSFLLITNYSSQTSLNKTLREQYISENERRAAELSNFFNNRRADLINLTLTRELSVFFENRALGMSMEYGLRQSVPPIKERFYSLVDRYHSSQGSLYRRIVFIDEHGKLLVDIRSAHDSAGMHQNIKKLSAPEHRNGAVVASDPDREIIISIAYYFKGRYSGQIVAWVQPQVLNNYVITRALSLKQVDYLVAGPNSVYVPAGRKQLTYLKDIEAGIPREFDATGEDGLKTRMIALKTPVKDTPFSFLSIVDVKDILGRLEPRSLLVGMGLLAVMIIGAAIFIVKLNMNMRSLVLQARLEESLLHEKRVSEKNKQLEIEIAERKQAEDALRKSEEQYRSLIETSPDIIYTVSAEDGAITSLNSAYEKITGFTREESIGRPYLEFIHHDDHPLARSMFEEILQKKLVRYELRYLTKSGEYLVTEFTSTALVDKRTVVGIIGVVRDITERKKLDEELRHAMKMQAIGQLAGGIAHDFNNILTVIIGYCNLMLLAMKTEDPLRSYADRIFSSAERAAQLTQNLLTFGRKQVVNIQSIDINEAIQRMEYLITSLIGEHIDVKIALTDEKLSIMADGAQVEQVVMNLVTNARDAMPQGGKLTITTGRFELDAEFKKLHGYGEMGSYACMCVTDTGIGMDHKTRERIFEPFFTTKDFGKGSGLGLSIIFGIIKQHHGYIDVMSESDKGTTFKIFLPILPSMIEKTSTTSLSAFYRGGTETILLAEDNAEVRNMLRKVLENSGYKVVEAVDGEDAVCRFREHHDSVQLLLLDVIMPRKNGGDAYKEIKAMRSDVKTIFLSGYTADIISKLGISEKEAFFLSKPVTPSLLKRKIREVLDG